MENQEKLFFLLLNDKTLAKIMQRYREPYCDIQSTMQGRVVGRS